MPWSFSQGWKVTKYTQGGTYAVAPTASATAHVKGSWLALADSLSDPLFGFVLSLGGTSAAARRFLVDIGIGAVDAETVLVSNIYFDVGGDGRQPHSSMFIPLSIPAGTRVAVRCQSETGSAQIEAYLLAIQQGYIGVPLFGRATTYGAETADTSGIQIDPGGTADTKGAYSEIVASTTNPIKACVLCVGNKSNTVDASFNFKCDVSVGPATEVVALSDYRIVGDAVSDAKKPVFSPPILCDVPAGTRLTGRAQCSGTNATDRLFDIVIIGYD